MCKLPDDEMDRPRAVPSSVNKSMSGNRTLQVVESAMYSTSIVDRAISVCSLLVQRTGQPARVMAYPVQLHTQWGSCGLSCPKRPPKSASG